MKILNFANAHINYIYMVEDLGKTGENIEIKSTESVLGGRGFNISISLANAGASKVYHAGILGAAAEELIAAFKEKNINVSGLKTAQEAAGYSLIFTDKYGRSRSFYNPGAEKNINEDFIDNALKRFSADDFLILDDSLNCSDYLINAAAQNGLKVCFCPQKTPKNLDNCDYVFLTAQMAYAFSGKSAREEVAEYFSEHFPNVNVIIDFEQKGFLYIGGEQTYFQPCFETRYIDETASFDCFIGFFLSLTAKGKKLSTAMRYAAAAAALSGSSIEAVAAMPTIEQLSSAIKNLKERDTGSSDRIKRIWSITEKYIDANITTAKISELSAELGYSEAYTGELIKSVLGMSFSELLQKKRCTLAAKMLKSTQLSVNEIIKAVGYDNETFFRNKFKLFLGMTPREYRKNR